MESPPSALMEQYRDPRKLHARLDLHRRFSTHPRGWQPFLLDALELAPAIRVLEVGCGSGQLWIDGRDRVPEGCQIVLSDRSPGMVAAARRALGDDPRFAFEVMDARPLAHPSGRFHRVLASHMLYHVPDVDAALAELRGVLHPEGSLLAATNGVGHLRELHTLARAHGLLQAAAPLTSPFELENGAGALLRHFAWVDREDHADSLAVTDPEALLAYVRSLPHAAPPDAAGYTEMRREIAERIRREGAFTISKASGVFLARARPPAAGGPSAAACSKACPVVTRQVGSRREILCFRHPEAGLQLVKGGVEPGESVRVAAVRELFEESGVEGCRIGRSLGTWESGSDGQVWGFVELLPRMSLPDRWSHFANDDGGHLFELFWHPLDQPPGPDWHPVFQRALAYVRDRLETDARERE